MAAKCTLLPSRHIESAYSCFVQTESQRPIFNKMALCSYLQQQISSDHMLNILLSYLCMKFPVLLNSPSHLLCDKTTDQEDIQKQIEMLALVLLYCQNISCSLTCLVEYFSALTIFFGYASSSTLHPRESVSESVSQWAQFRTSVAWSL